MKYRVKTPLKLDPDTKAIAPGAVVELETEAAQELLAIDAIEADSALDLAQAGKAPELDPEIEDAFLGAEALAGMGRDALISYVREHLSAELADALKGNEGQVRNQVKKLIADAKAQLYAAKEGK
jgi:hypothetical protein